jgi:hypothetical protein
MWTGSHYGLIEVLIFHCRNKEITMERLRQEQYNDLNAEHIRQKQILVNEFKQAQEIFKKRIADLETA